MDPISIIVGALVAGASESVRSNASQAVSDAYQGLKTLIVDKWKSSGAQEDVAEKETEAKIFLKQVEEDPETYKAFLQTKLQKVMPEPPAEVLGKASEFTELLKQAGLTSGDQINVSGSQGVQIGSGNNQTNTFN